MIITPYKKVNPTVRKRVYRLSGREEYTTKTASDSGLVYQFISINRSQAKFRLIADVANPPEPIAPAINWDFTFTVNSSGRTSVVGKHDGYPAYEIYRRLNSDSPYAIYFHDPRQTGETPFSLAGSMEHNVNAAS
ncbi:MAG: hypothetical protein BLM47_13800 [Candidatus Reconcilbacillus cellulovorans]|uniref:Uncharacterized protein n=1 Tax=Candidatus Reconcilbacillus cellulovorans TaxID=1906605 RepID=A0A2A6DWE7_9BACL|nr:MAG: hypothetical protein BLM47_13800 [Candidatus Reconcilbacillus cellulovorans]